MTPGFRSGSLLPLLSGRVRRDGRNGGLPDDPEPQLGGELLECRQADPDLLAHEPGQGRHLDPGPPGQLPDGQPALPDRLPDDLGRGERSSWVAASSETATRRSSAKHAVENSISSRFGSLDGPGSRSKTRRLWRPGKRPQPLVELHHR